jgi:hypothetical protein
MALYLAMTAGSMWSWQQEQQLRDRSLDEMNAGGFERFEESAGEPMAAILLPAFLAPAGDEAQRARRRARGAVEPAQQQARGFSSLMNWLQ